MTLLARSLLLALAATALLPAAAHAAAKVTVPETGTVLVESTDPRGNDAEARPDNNAITTSTAGNVMTIDEEGGTGILQRDAPIDVCWPGDDSSMVECDTTKFSRVRMRLGPGDDTATALNGAIRYELFGEGGDDSLTSAGGADVLDGGSGSDMLQGGSGNDRLLAADGVADDGVTCGQGDDDLTGDVADGYGDECEVVAPAFIGKIALTGTPRVYSAMNFDIVGGDLTLHGTIDHPSFAQTIRWYRCDGTGQGCIVAQQDPSRGTRVLEEPDAYHRLYAEMEISNRAGTGAVRTALSEVVQPLVGPLPPPDMPYSDPFAPPPFNLTLDAATILQRSLRAAAGQLGTLNLRRLAKERSILVRITAPGEGTIKSSWTVPAKIARRYGVKSRRAVTLASGSVRARGVNELVTLPMRTTKSGRRIMARAKRLEVRIVGSLKPQGSPGTLQVTQPMTLRRR